jgi:hypothetical protein
MRDDLIGGAHHPSPSIPIIADGVQAKGAQDDK